MPKLQFVEGPKPFFTLFAFCNFWQKIEGLVLACFLLPFCCLSVAFLLPFCCLSFTYLLALCSHFVAMSTEWLLNGNRKTAKKISSISTENYRKQKEERKILNPPAIKVPPILATRNTALAAPWLAASKTLASWPFGILSMASIDVFVFLVSAKWKKINQD